MDLNTIRLFVTVAETGSFTRAGRDLGLTTSGVSRALSRLEQEVGVRLIQRTTRKLNLTESGRAYFEQVKGALALIEEASEGVSEMREDPKGIVRITAPPALTNSLIPILAEFLERYPEVRVEILSSQGIEDLVERSIDLAVRIGRLRDSSLVARRVGHMVTALFATRAYVKRKGMPRTPADLTRHNCVLFRSQNGRDTWRLRDGTREFAVEVTGSISVDEIRALHQAVLAGVGIGSISFFSSSQMKSLVRILPRYIYADLPISIVSPSRRLEPARVVLLRDFLAARLSALPWRGETALRHS